MKSDEAKAAEIRATREKEGTERPERSEQPEKPERPASRPSTDQVGFRFATVFAMVFAWGKYMKIHKKYERIQRIQRKFKEFRHSLGLGLGTPCSTWALPFARNASRLEASESNWSSFHILCQFVSPWHLDTSCNFHYFSMCTVYICVLFFIIFLCVPCVLWIFMGFQRFLQQNKAHALSRRGSGGSWRRMVSLKPAVSAWSNKTESLRSVIFARDMGTSGYVGTWRRRLPALLLSLQCQIMLNWFTLIKPLISSVKNSSPGWTIELRGEIWLLWLHLLFPAWQHYSRGDVTVLKVMLTRAMSVHCVNFFWPATGCPARIVVGNRWAAAFRGRRWPAWPEGTLVTHGRHSLGMSGCIEDFKRLRHFLCPGLVSQIEEIDGNCFGRKVSHRCQLRPFNL